MKLFSTIVAMVVCFSSLAAAEDAAPTAPAAAEAAPAATPETKWYDKVKFEGLADAYYGYRFQNSGDASTAPSQIRAFDGANNQFTLGYAELAVSMPAEPAGFRIDLGFGPTAEASSSDGAGNPVMKHIQQAYVSAKLFDKLVVDLGKFVTSAGAEVIEAKDNWLYSRGMLFGFAIPFAHTGLRLSMPIGDSFTLQGGVLNGWDTALTSLSFKTFNLSGLLKTSGGTMLAVNFYGGPNQTPDLLLLFDVVFQQDIGKLSVNVNGDFGMQGTTKWYGGSLMAKFMAMDNLRIAARVEYFGDPDGVRTGVGESSYLTATAGVGIGLSGPANVEFRPEIRHDQQLGGMGAAYGAGTMQTTLQLSMLGWF